MKNKGIFFFVGSIFLVFCVTKTYANFWNTPEIPENLTDAEVLDKWIKIDKNIKGLVHSAIKTLMPAILRSSEKVKLSSECIKESMHLISGLRSLKTWAVSFIDSSAKIPDGLLTGSVAFLGVYDECLNISVPHARNKTEVLYRGKYCTLELTAPLPPKKRRYRLHDQLETLTNFSGSDTVKFITTSVHLNYFLRPHLGVCVPSGCTEDDLNQMLHLASEYLLLKLEVTHCEVARGKVQLSGIQIFTIVLCVFLGTLVLLATWFDIRNKQKNTPDERMSCRILHCFSLKSNFKRLASTKTSADSLMCLHGFRFISITWVVMGHSYLYAAWFSRSYTSPYLYEDSLTGFFIQMILNGSEAVDSFFFMAGMLVCYITLKMIKKEKHKFDIRAFLFHRLWRIIPAYYFILLFVTLTPLLGSGPLFYETWTESFEPCSKYWWRNALFISNFFHMKDMCMMHTWFISSELQLYLASLLVILPMLKSEKIGVVISILLIAVSIIYTGIITYVKDAAPSMIMSYADPETRNMALLYTYGNTLSRFGPYFMGVLVGYLLFKFPDIKIPKKFLILGWCLAVVSTGTTIFYTTVWLSVRAPTRLEELMYGTFYKVSYTAGIAWMLFCCCTGNGGFINDFLSWKVWIPLGRLTFLIYLIEPIFQTLFIANFKIPQEFSHLHYITQFFGFLCISSLLAMILNLLVESPTWQMEKIIFSTAKAKMEKSGMKNVNINDMPIITMNGKKDSTVENGIENVSFDSKI